MVSPCHRGLQRRASWLHLPLPGDEFDSLLTPEKGLSVNPVKFNLMMSAAARGILGRFSIKGASCPLTYVTRVRCQHNLGSFVLNLMVSEGFFLAD
jgi:hypothetical protein